MLWKKDAVIKYNETITITALVIQSGPQEWELGRHHISPCLHHWDEVIIPVSACWMKEWMNDPPTDNDFLVVKLVSKLSRKFFRCRSPLGATCTCFEEWLLVSAATLYGFSLTILTALRATLSICLFSVAKEENSWNPSSLPLFSMQQSSPQVLISSGKRNWPSTEQMCGIYTDVHASSSHSLGGRHWYLWSAEGALHSERVQIVEFELRDQLTLFQPHTGIKYLLFDRPIHY